MKYSFTLLIFSLLSYAGAAFGQTITRDFPYAGTTYRYQIVPVQDSSVYRLHIQALKSREQGTTIHKGRIAATFSHPRHWRTTIFASQKKKGGWTTRQESYLEVSFDRQRQAVAYFDNGTLIDLAEPAPTDNFSGEWQELNRRIALITAVEYYIMNYNRALGQHEAGEELETEESFMLEQMMAARQEQRDSLVAAIIEQRQQPTADIALTAEAIAQAATESPAMQDSAAVATVTGITPTASDSTAIAQTTVQPTPQSIRLEGEFSLPFVSQLPIDDKIYFLEARHDDLYPGRIELKLRRYDADSNRTELVYVSYVRIKDSTDVGGNYNVLIHLAENNGYKWTTYPNSFLECSLDLTAHKMSYRVVGSKLASRLQNPEHAQKEEELPFEITGLEKQDVLLSAARYFIKSCSQVLMAN
jgi:hypothetical protein